MTFLYYLKMIVKHVMNTKKNELLSNNMCHVNDRKYVTVKSLDYLMKYKNVSLIIINISHPIHINMLKFAKKTLNKAQYLIAIYHNIDLKFNTREFLEDLFLDLEIYYNFDLFKNIEDEDE